MAGASMDGEGWLLWDTQQSLGVRPRRVHMHVGIFAVNLQTPIKLGRKDNQGKPRSVPAFTFLHLPPQRRGDALPHVLPGKEMAVKLLRSFAVPPAPPHFQSANLIPAPLSETRKQFGLN